MFRHRKFCSLFFPCFDTEQEVATSQFDENGNEHVSIALVSSKAVIDSLPSPSDFTIAQQLSSGNLRPVSLDDFTCDNLDDSVANTIINSLND